MPEKPLSHIHLAHLLHQAFARCRLLLFAHYARLLVMLPFFHLGKDTRFFDLFFETAQGYIKIIVFLI